jgi:hypothetical protein
MLQRRGVGGKDEWRACRSLSWEELLVFIDRVLVTFGDWKVQRTKMLAKTAVLAMQSLVQSKPVSVHLRFRLVADV